MTHSPEPENFKTFMQRMEAYFPYSECIRAKVFYKLVKNEFRSQYRKSEFNSQGEAIRYFEHLRRVAILLIDEVGLIDFTVIMSALGHDAIEDTRMELEEITFVCGEEVAKTIAMCSKTPKNGFRDRLIKLGTWRALAVKVADRIDNLRTLGTDSDFIQKTLKETREMYIPLSCIMELKAPPEFKKEISRLKELLRNTLSEIDKNNS